MAININIDSQVSQTITDGVTDKAPSENAVFDALALKVDKVTGKQLSTEDYTTTEKSKLAGIAAGAEVNVNADWNATSGDAQILNKPVISSSITIGTTPITSGVAGRVLFQNGGNVVGQDSALFWDNTNKRLGIGATPDASTRLDIRSQGALSTDIAFRVRNSADTANIFQVNGDGNVYSNGKGLVSTNTAFGINTLGASTTGGDNSAFGNGALINLTSGIRLVSIGSSALGSATTCAHSIGIGFQAAAGMNASNCIAIGAFSLQNVSSGGSNIGIGYIACNGITTGSNNIHLGQASSGAMGITTGSNNTIIGSNILGLASGLSNNVIIADGQANQLIRKDANHNQILGVETTLLTTATNGFTYIPTCEGTPTGTPTTITGKAPIVIDSTNNKMYIYTNATWVALN